MNDAGGKLIPSNYPNPSLISKGPRSSTYGFFYALLFLINQMVNTDHIRVKLHLVAIHMENE